MKLLGNTATSLQFRALPLPCCPICCWHTWMWCPLPPRAGISLLSQLQSTKVSSMDEERWITKTLPLYVCLVMSFHKDTAWGRQRGEIHPLEIHCLVSLAPLSVSEKFLSPAIFSQLFLKVEWSDHCY